MINKLHKSFSLHLPSAGITNAYATQPSFHMGSWKERQVLALAQQMLYPQSFLPIPSNLIILYKLYFTDVISSCCAF